MMTARQRSPATGAVLIAAVFFLIAPLVIVIVFSFHSSPSLSLPFQGFSLRWYRATFSSPDFVAALLNSAQVAASVAVITFVLGTLAAYGLTRTKSRARVPLTALFFLSLALPGVFLGMALLVFFSSLGVPLSLSTIAAAHFIVVFPFFYLMARTAISSIDPALEEAAVDLGATRSQVFTRVTLPLVAPVLLGAACLAFALSFDEFVVTLFVAGPDSTLPLFIWSRLRRIVDPSINTVSTLLLVTSVLLWLLSFTVTARGLRGRPGGITLDPET